MQKSILQFSRLLVRSFAQAPTYNNYYRVSVLRHRKRRELRRRESIRDVEGVKEVGNGEGCHTPQPTRGFENLGKRCKLPSGVRSGAAATNAFW